jgi:probable addiction module antidote protein
MEYNQNQMGYLKDRQKAIADLNLTLKYMKKDDFLFCLHNIAIQQGVANIAQKTGLSREGLYKILQPTGNPHLDVLMLILDSMGLELQLSLKAGDIHTRKSCSPMRTNSFKQTYPALAAYWHPNKNAGLTANDIVPSSRKRIWWRCWDSNNDVVHEWEATASSLVITLKKDFLKNHQFTERSFADRLKKVCPICANQ